MEEENNEEKLYRHITEVSEMLGVPESSIRYWVEEFPMLKPRKGQRGLRLYTLKDIDMIRQIQWLVKEEGYSIDGARKILGDKKRRKLHHSSLLQSLEVVKSKLENIRDNMKENS